MKVDVFNLKYGAEYKNPRNLVAGLTNKKTVSNIIKDVDFIAYEIVNFDNNEAVNEIENPSFQLKHLKNWVSLSLIMILLMKYLQKYWSKNW
jgi:NAD-dependent DNA ligase